MSSRALRKLQREQEEKRQLAELKQESEGEEDDSPATQNKDQRNAYDLLNAQVSDGEVEDEEQSPDTENNVEQTEKKYSSAEPDLEGQGKAPAKKKGKSTKKKKKSGKTESSRKEANVPANTGNDNLDEIDRALKDLKGKEGEMSQPIEPSIIGKDLESFYQLLSIDSRSLNALNEMKKLFGSTVLDGENEGGAGPARRRGRGPQQVDLGRALAGRNNPVTRGQGLAGLALRKNIFMLGKEEWPKGTSGGLAMEVVEKAWDFTTEFRFFHNTAYQDIQRQFDNCVESLDPERMIQLLLFNPYHISTLLQVSEIAKQQGDLSVSSDLLERALFTFGRSVHSSFHTALAEGKARLDFRRPENREFWLAAWRYIGSLGQRGTWRTAYEWAKLMLSLDPEEDPFSIRLIIDQLAIRGGQFEHFIKLASTEAGVVDWGQKSANIEISLGLAHYKMKHTIECRAVLHTAIRHYPWMFAEIFRELNIDHIPKAIWGTEPRNSQERLESSAYATRAKDIWNTPEAMSLLVEVVETCPGPPMLTLPPPKGLITRNIARHILLSEIPRLIGLIPENYTTERSSASDPLPPEDNLPSYGREVEIHGRFDSRTGIDPENSGSDSGDDDDDNDDNDDDDDAAATPFSYFPGLHRLLSAMGFAHAEPNDSPPSLDATIDGDDDDVARNTNEELLVDSEEAATAADLQAILNELSTADMRPTAQGTDGTSPTPPEPPVVENPWLAAQGDTPVTAEVAAAAATAHRRLQAQLLQAINSAGGPTSEAAAETPAASPAHAATPADSDSADDSAQRWLAGQGLQALKAFVEAHGTDEGAWAREGVDAEPVHSYAARIGLLQNREKRNFILEYALPQGAGEETGRMVKRVLAR